MEDFVIEIVADQEFQVGDQDKGGFVAALPRNPFDHIGHEDTRGDDAKALDAQAPAADVGADLFHNIESLKKEDALTRLLQLEEDQERTFFEMGAVLSMIQKRKWFNSCASLDEWVEKNTAMSRAKARALIQIYDAIVKSGVKRADVEHIGWTKLRAIASVLNKETIGHWVEIASKHSKVEVLKLVRDHPLQSANQKPGTRADSKVKTFILQRDQKQCVQAAIDSAKKLNATDHESAALVAICQNYIEGQVTLTEEALVDMFIQHLNLLDKTAAGEIMKAVCERVKHAR